MHNPKQTRNVSDLIALVKARTAYWKAIARQRFDANPELRNGAFEQIWPQTLTNFFLAETVRTADSLRQLSEGRDN